ncbi:MAG: hypothetical protein SNH01_01140 [Rikenellaceae bacterium]
MGLFSNLFGWGKKKEEQQADVQSQVEEFVSLIGIYNQAFVMTHVGITNIKMFPDLMMYKQVMHIPTVGGKVGVGEKAYIKKWMMAEYGMDETFFKEIDSSIRRNCKGMKDVQSYFLQFGAFTNDFLTHLYSEHQMKISASIFIKKMLRSTVESAVDKMMSNTVWKKFETNTAVARIQNSVKSFGFSKKWMSEFAYQVLILSKKK